MKKIIIMIFCAFIISGCSAVYNIEFKDGKVFENFSIKMNNNTESDSIKYFDNNDLYATINPEMIEYAKSKKTGNTETEYNYSYKYSIDNYINSMALSSCFEGYNIIKEKNYYLISTSDGVKCMTSDYSTIVDNIDIVIESNHKLIDTNADEIRDYKYIWHIDKSNYKEKSIKLKVYQNKYVFNYKGELTKKIVIISLILSVLVILFMSIYIKRKKSNKF